MPTLSELGRRVKTRYPGKFDDLPDHELGRAVQEEFPGQFDEYTEGMSPLEADTYLGRLARGPQPSHPMPMPTRQISLDRIDAQPRPPVGSEKLGGPPPIAPPPFAGSDKEPFRRGFMELPITTRSMPPGLEGLDMASEGVRQITNAERQTVPRRAPGPMPSRLDVASRYGNEIAGGLSKIVRGGMKMVELPLLPIMAANPVRAALGIGAGMLAQGGVETGARKLGVPEGYAQLAGDVAGLTAGTFAATRPPLRLRPNATPPIGDSSPAPVEEPLPLGTAEKGPKSARESAEVFAREFPPPAKSAEESARVLAWNTPPETRPSSFSPVAPIPPTGGGPNPPVGAVARMRQETAIGPAVEALPERLMGQTPLQAKIRSEVGDAYASIIPSDIMNAAKEPGPKITIRRSSQKGAITATRDDINRLRSRILPSRQTEEAMRVPASEEGTPWKEPLRNGEERHDRSGGRVQRNDADVTPLFGMLSPNGAMYTGRLHEDISGVLGLKSKIEAIQRGFIRVANHERGMRTKNSTLEFVDSPNTRRRAIDLIRNLPEDNYVTLDVWSQGPRGWEKTDLSKFYRSPREAAMALARAEEAPSVRRAGQKGAITISKKDVEKLRSALGIKGKLLPPDREPITPGLLDSILDTHNQTGGSTYSLISGESKAGQDLWAYSPVKSLERQIPRELTVQDLQDYISQPEVSKLLNDPSGKYHLGTWKSGDTNFLDVSVLEPDKLKALRDARKANQLAIFNLKSFEEVPVNRGLIRQGLEDLAQKAREAIKLKNRRGSFVVDKEDLNDVSVWGAALMFRGIRGKAWEAEMKAEFPGLSPKNLEKVSKKAEDNLVRWVNKSTHMPDVEEILSLYREGEAGKDWYVGPGKKVRELFGDDADIYLKFLAATSPQKNIRQNIDLANKAYIHWTKEGNFDTFQGVLPVVRGMLNKIAAGEKKFVVGRELKAPSFSRNLAGDPDPVTVDRWMARIFGMGDNITEREYGFIDYTLTQIAKEHGVEPRQMQAALWKAVKERASNIETNPAEDFSVVLEELVRNNDPVLAQVLVEAKRRIESGLAGKLITPKAKSRRATQAGFIRFGGGDRVREASRKVEREIIDRFSDIRRFTAPAGLPRDKDPYVAARLYAGRGGRIINRLQDLSKSVLRPAYKEKLLKPMEELALYERYEELASRGITEFPEGLTLADIQSRKAALEASLGPKRLARVRELISNYRDFMNGILQELKDAQVISNEAYTKILQDNQHYIPLERVSRLDETIEHAPIGGEVFSVPAQQVIHRIKGSERPIMNPIEASVKRVFQAMSVIGRNRAALQMADLAEDPYFSGQVIKLNPNTLPPEGMGTFHALRNGRKETYAVPKPVADAMHHLHYQDVDLVTRMAQKTGAWLRAGATSLNMAFIPPNVIRDVQTAHLVSEVGFSPVDFLRGFLESIHHGSDFRSYMESGAAFSGMMEGYRDIPSTVKDLTGQMTLKKAFNAVNPLEYIRKVGEISEQATRLGVYKRALRKGRGEADAAFISRNATVDFSKAGSTMRVLNLWVPFLNARTQGTVNVFGTAAERPAHSALVLGATVAVPVIATYLHNSRMFPKIWDSIAPFEKDNNFIIIYGEEVDQEGNPTQVVKIPKGDVGRIFGNPIENYLTWKDNKDAKSISKLALQIGSDISPISFEKEGKFSSGAVLSSTLPPLAKAGVEWATNQNFYTGRRIVPESLEKASPEQQYKSTTSPIMVKLGKTFHLSPLKLQNTAGTLFGGLGRQIIDPTTAPRQISRRFSGAYGKTEINQKFERLRALDQGRIDQGVEDRRNAEKLFREFRAAPPDRRNALVQARLPQMTEAEAEHFLSLLEQQDRGLDPFERTLGQAPIETRVRFLAEELQKASPEQRRAILADWDRKGLLTDRVVERLLTVLP